jgi:polyhydroxyalkanoate synthesis regulator phasin
MNAAKKVVKAKDTLMKENVKKGHEKVGGLEKQVADLKAQMQKLIDSPEMRGELSNYTAKLEKTEQVLEKLKAAIEKSSPKKAKKETKDDE